VHPDQSWVAITNDRGVIRGFAQNRLDGGDIAIPVDYLSGVGFPTRTPCFEDGFLACAMPGRLEAGQWSIHGTQLLEQGFVETLPGFFEHPADKSWVAFTTQPSVERGVGNERFSHVPVSPTRINSFDPNITGRGFLLAAASPSLQALTLADVKLNDAVLIDAGFTRTADPSVVYTHADGCFFAFAPGKTYIGQNQQLFSPLPRPLDVQNAVPSRPEHSFCAVAKTTHIDASCRDVLWDDEHQSFDVSPGDAHSRLFCSPADRAADIAILTQRLTRLGFAETVGGVLYTHADGSWLALQGSSLFRGVGLEPLVDVPARPTAGPVVRDHSTPSLPRSMRAFAIARVGMLNSQNVHTQCPLNGFVLLEKEYIHPDGSWVDVSSAGLRVGWKGYGLGQMQSHYRNGSGWV
jgi:hypothetical protein